MMHRWVIVAVGMAALAVLWWVQQQAVAAHALVPGDVRSAGRVTLGWVVMVLIVIVMVAPSLRHR